MEPFPERYLGVKQYRVYCGRYVLYVKVDRRRTVNEFRELQLMEDRELFLIARDLRTSKEWTVVQGIAQYNVRTQSLAYLR